MISEKITNDDKIAQILKFRENSRKPQILAKSPKWENRNPIVKTPEMAKLLDPHAGPKMMIYWHSLLNIANLARMANRDRILRCAHVWPARARLAKIAENEKIQENPKILEAAIETQLGPDLETPICWTLWQSSNLVPASSLRGRKISCARAN